MAFKLLEGKCFNTLNEEKLNLHRETEEYKLAAAKYDRIIAGGFDGYNRIENILIRLDVIPESVQVRHYEENLSVEEVRTVFKYTDILGDDFSWHQHVTDMINSNRDDDILLK